MTRTGAGLWRVVAGIIGLCAILSASRVAQFASWPRSFVKLAAIAACWTGFSAILFALWDERTARGAAALWQKLRERCLLAVAVVILVTGARYGALLSGAVANFDSALYNTQIEDGNIGDRAIHWGYFVLGYVFARPLPVNIDFAMNLWCAAMGIVGAATLLLLVWWHSRDACLAALTSLAISLSANYVYSAVYSEVYIIQTTLCLLALALWHRGYAILSGLCFAFGLTVSILAAVIAPLFLFPTFRPSALARAAGSAIIGYALFVILNHESLLYGDRGLLTGAPWEGGMATLLRGWVASVKMAVVSFPILMPFLVLGMLSAAWTRRERTPYFAGILSAVFVLHAVTAGRFPNWGFDIVAYPILSIPLLSVLRHSLTSVAPGRIRSGRLAIAASLAVCVNSICSAVLSAETLRQPAVLRSFYSAIGDEVGRQVPPIGRFDLAAAYARANGQPLRLPRPVFRPDVAQAYIVVDSATLSDLVAQGVDPTEIQEHRADPLVVWYIAFRPP